jgi:divalent metal cation (Fe/Co/Zn/Cd) transporter
MVVALGVTILLKEVTARYAEFLSSKIASGTLHADAWHHRSDAISSLLVVIALVAGNFGYPAVDGWAGLGVSLFLIYTGYEIAKEAVDDLIGKPPSSEEVETIRQIVLDVNGVLGAHDIIVHSYGHDKFVSIHVEIDAIKSTGEAHDISEEVESRLEASLGVEPTIHLDPVHPNDPLVQDVMNHLSSITSQDDRVTDFHDIRVVNTENHQVILFGTNMKIGTTQKDIVACNQGLEKSLKEKFNNYEVQIKVSPMHRF